jgi:germination protein M
VKKRILCLLALLLLLSAGCTRPARPPEPEGLKLWFPAELSQWEQSSGALDTCPYGGEDTVPALVGALLEGPSADSGLLPALPAGTELLGWELREETLHLALSRHYGTLAGLELTLADYCITLTMTQLEEVRGVCITVEGKAVRYRDRQTLYADDVVFSGAEEEPVELSVPLYFGMREDNELGWELRIFRLTESELPTLAVLEALAAGPEDPGMRRLLPEGVGIYSAHVEGGVCYADFSAELMTTVPLDEESQVLILSSLVETLCGLDAVSTVQILVEGETVPYYGMVDISQPLEPAGGRN